MDRILLTTNSGIEDLVVDEFREMAEREDLPYESAEPEPFGLGGRILVETDAPPDQCIPKFERMRSIHHVLRYVHEFEFEPEAPLESIESTVYELEIPEMADAETFRVTSNRYGDHPFTSVDVQRSGGSAVDRKYDADVDLEDFEVEVRVDIRENRCMVGTQYTQRALSKRFPLEYTPVASLKTNVAYAMLRLARIERHRPERLLDPFCGAGTILMETAEVFPNLEIVGSDKSTRAVTGARQNARAAGLESRIDVREANARRLGATYRKGFADLIVTNPPYGERLDAGMDFEDFYGDVLGQFARTLGKGGRVVMLVHKRGVFRAVIGRYPQLEIRHVRIVETGGLYPGIYVLQKRTD